LIIVYIPLYLSNLSGLILHHIYILPLIKLVPRKINPLSDHNWRDLVVKDSFKIGPKC